MRALVQIICRKLEKKDSIETFSFPFLCVCIVPSLVGFQDIMKFMVIFFIVFLAFLVGLNNLYWYYDESVREQVQLYNSAFYTGENEVDTAAEKAFGT